MVKSRELYKDCIKAKEMFEGFVKEEKLSEAKILWFACLSMLRAIGHVLDKVDSKSLPGKFSEEAKLRYQKWKTDDMFSDFLDSERNSILKEYESSLAEEKKAKIEAVTFNGIPVTHKGELVVHTSTVTNLIKKHGTFPGECPIAILNNALAWWDKELTELEQVAKNQPLNE